MHASESSSRVLHASTTSGGSASKRAASVQSTSLLVVASMSGLLKHFERYAGVALLVDLPEHLQRRRNPVCGQEAPCEHLELAFHLLIGHRILVMSARIFDFGFPDFAVAQPHLQPTWDRRREA